MLAVLTLRRTSVWFSNLCETAGLIGEVQNYIRSSLAESKIELDMKQSEPVRDRLIGVEQLLLFGRRVCWEVLSAF